MVDTFKALQVIYIEVWNQPCSTYGRVARYEQSFDAKFIFKVTLLFPQAHKLFPNL